MVPPATAGAVRRTVWLVLAAAAVLGTLLVVVTSELPAAARSVAVDLSLVVVSLVTGGALLWRGRRSHPRQRRRSWYLLAAGSAVAALAGVPWVLGAEGRPSLQLVNSTGLVLAMLCTVVALLSYPVARTGRLERVRTCLDGAVVGASMLSIVLGVAFAALPAADRTGLDPTVLALPVLDCVIATLAVLLVLRCPPSDRWRLFGAMLGFLVIAVADTSYLTRLISTGDTTSGSVSDLGWIAGYLVIAVVALSPDRPRRDPASTPGYDASGPRRGRPLLGTLVVFTFFVGATGLALLGVGVRLEPATRALLLLALLAAAARQVLLLLDNERLRGWLSAQVAQRSTELAQVAERSDVVMGSVQEGIFVADDRGRIVFVNQAVTRLLGYQQDELMGRDALEVLHAGAPGAADGDGATRGYLARAALEGRPSADVRELYRHRDGHLLPVEVSVSPLAREGARGSVVVFRDTTHRDEVDRMKTEFVSVVSHELRTPLTSIRGALGLVAAGVAGELPPQADRMIQIASQSSERLVRMVNDLLDIERLQSGRLPLTVAEHDAARLLRRAVEATRALFAATDVTVEVDARSCVVLGDDDRIEQVLVNLLSNAAKYAPDGSVVRATVAPVEPPPPDGPQVAFAVVDRGRGIPADQLTAIFSRFVQVDQSDTRDREGSGLGLAICADLAEAMGGRVWAESEPGVRTAFHLVLPAGSPRVDVAPAEPMVQPDTAAQPPTAAQPGTAGGQPGTAGAPTR